MSKNLSIIQLICLKCIFSPYTDGDDDESDPEIHMFEIDTSKVEEIPAKEPKFYAMPLKSALKKKGLGSGSGTPQNTPTQEVKGLTLQQELQASFK